jgi:hypothetical protein
MLTSTSALAQNTSGVFGPEVIPGSRDFEARVAYAPSSDGRDSLFASRLHYQQAVSDNLRLRGLILGSDSLSGGFDYRFVQFEALYQFREDEIHGWDSAIRFDVRLTQDRADVLGLHWTNEFKLSSQWAVRAIVLTAIQVGNEREDGLFLQTRGSLRYKTNSNYVLQVQMFNTYGSTGNFPDFNDQLHSIGPAVSGKLVGDWSFETGVLFGISDRSSDVDFRFFLSRSL